MASPSSSDRVVIFRHQRISEGRESLALSVHDELRLAVSGYGFMVDRAPIPRIFVAHGLSVYT